MPLNKAASRERDGRAIVYRPAPPKASGWFSGARISAAIGNSVRSCAIVLSVAVQPVEETFANPEPWAAPDPQRESASIPPNGFRSLLHETPNSGRWKHTVHFSVISRRKRHKGRAESQVTEDLESE